MAHPAGLDFSSSDGSDPAENGRRYELRRARYLLVPLDERPGAAPPSERRDR